MEIYSKCKSVFKINLLHCFFSSMSRWNMSKNNLLAKRAFTIIEVIIGLVITWIGVLAIIGAINYWTRALTMTRSQIIAANLAREWVETMFNKRDTNRQIYPSKKDKCWLVNNSDPNSTTCESLPRVWPGLWIPNISSGGVSVLNRSTSTDLQWMDFWQPGFSPKDSISSAKLCNIWWKWFVGWILKPVTINSAFWRAVGKSQTADYTSLVIPKFVANTPFNTLSDLGGVPDWGKGVKKEFVLVYQRDWISYTAVFPETYWLIDPLDVKMGTEWCNQKYGDFYRYVYVHWLYDKTSGWAWWEKITCNNGDDVWTCGQNTPKELYFCSIVDYQIEWANRRVQLCSSLTNFEK